MCLGDRSYTTCLLFKVKFSTGFLLNPPELTPSLCELPSSSFPLYSSTPPLPQHNSPGFIQQNQYLAISSDLTEHNFRCCVFWCLLVRTVVTTTLARLYVPHFPGGSVIPTPNFDTSVCGRGGQVVEEAHLRDIAALRALVGTSLHYMWLSTGCLKNFQSTSSPECFRRGAPVPALAVPITVCRCKWQCTFSGLDLAHILSVLAHIL